MAFELDTAATADPVDLDQVLAHCRIVDEADYARVVGLVKKATRYVEGVLGRQLITAVWKLHLDAFPKTSGEVLEIRKPPVQTVDEIKYYDGVGVLQTWAGSKWQADTVSEPARVRPVYGQIWPVTRPDTLNAVSIEFTAGYGDAAAAVPETIRHAIELLAGHWFEHREPITSETVNAVPFTVEALLGIEDWGRYP